MMKVADCQTTHRQRLKTSRRKTGKNSGPRILRAEVNQVRQIALHGREATNGKRKDSENAKHHDGKASKRQPGTPFPKGKRQQNEQQPRQNGELSVHEAAVSGPFSGPLHVIAVRRLPVKEIAVKKTAKDVKKPGLRKTVQTQGGGGNSCVPPARFRMKNGLFEPKPGVRQQTNDGNQGAFPQDGFLQPAAPPAKRQQHAKPDGRINDAFEFSHGATGRSEDGGGEIKFIRAGNRLNHQQGRQADKKNHGNGAAFLPDELQARRQKTESHDRQNGQRMRVFPDFPQ